MVQAVVAIGAVGLVLGVLIGVANIYLEVKEDYKNVYDKEIDFRKNSTTSCKKSIRCCCFTRSR